MVVLPRFSASRLLEHFDISVFALVSFLAQQFLWRPTLW